MTTQDTDKDNSNGNGRGMMMGWGEEMGPNDSVIIWAPGDFSFHLSFVPTNLFVL